MRVALGILLGMTGCEDADDGLSPEDFRRAEKDARCEYMVRCGLAPGRDACQAAIAQDPDLIQAVGAVAFGRAQYDPEAAQQYVDTLTDASCEGTLAVANELRAALAAVFEGKVPEGQPCWSDQECAGDDGVCDTLACRGSGQLCCHGTCRRYRTIGVGSACPLQADEMSFSGCSDDAYCAPPEDDGSGEPPTMGICTPRSNNGMPCGALDGCQDGQRCNVGGSNLCYVLSGDGEMCNPNLANGSCVRIDQVCDAGSSSCVSAPGPGQPCVRGRCQLHAVCQEDVCIARLVEYEPCDGSVPCLGDLSCQDGFCQRSRVALVCVAGEPPPEPDPGG
jgi:hypothetical protein